MSEDEKGKRFLELIDQQNNVQWNIITKLTLLIKSKWNSSQIQNEIESLIESHSEITKELNSLDIDSSIL